MKKKVYVLVGAPGSGKTWVANQIRDKYTYVPHDKFGLKQTDDFIRAIKAHSAISEKPVVCDTPFSVSMITEPLSQAGYDVRPVFIIEQPSVTKQRYEDRYRNEKKGQEVIPQGHLTRIETYKKRAEELKAPFGTSTEILNYMRNHDANQESAAVERPQPRIEHKTHNAQRNNERDEKAQREKVQDPPAEAVRDVRGWAMGGDLWQD